MGLEPRNVPGSKCQCFYQGHQEKWMPFPCIQTVGAKFRLYAGKTIHDFKRGASAVLSCVELSRPLFTDCTKFVWLQASASIMCTFYAVWTCPASRVPPHWLALHLCKAVRGNCLHGRSCSLPRLSQTATLTRAQRHCGPAAAGETKNPRPCPALRSRSRRSPERPGRHPGGAPHFSSARMSSRSESERTASSRRFLLPQDDS